MQTILNALRRLALVAVAALFIAWPGTAMAQGDARFTGTVLDQTGARTAAWDGGVLRVRDAGTGATVRELPVPENTFAGRTALTPDGGGVAVVTFAGGYVADAFVAHRSPDAIKVSVTT